MKEPNKRVSLITITLLLTAIWLCSPALLWLHHNATHILLRTQPLDHGDYGAFGDGFGHINSLFSALALIGVIYSLHLQEKELRSLGSTFKIDSFEKTFFNMLDLFVQQREKFNNGDVAEKYRRVGSDYIGGFWHDIYNMAAKHVKEDTPNTLKVRDVMHELGRADYRKLLEVRIPQHHPESYSMTTYLRSIETTLNFIENYLPHHQDQVSEEIKNKYNSIFFSQLTLHEILFICLFAIAHPETSVAKLSIKSKISSELPEGLLTQYRWDQLLV
jgi:hypothetical protein